MLGSLGLGEIAVLVVVVGVVIWHRRIPQLARNMGDGIRGFIRGVRQGD